MPLPGRALQHRPCILQLVCVAGERPFDEESKQGSRAPSALERAACEHLLERSQHRRGADRCVRHPLKPTGGTVFRKLLILLRT